MRFVTYTALLAIAKAADCNESEEMCKCDEPSDPESCKLYTNKGCTPSEDDGHSVNGFEWCECDPATLECSLVAAEEPCEDGTSMCKCETQGYMCSVYT